VGLLHAYLVNADAYVENAYAYVVNGHIDISPSMREAKQGRGLVYKSSIASQRSSTRDASRPVNAYTSLV